MAAEQRQNDKSKSNKGSCQDNSCGSNPQEQQQHLKGQFKEKSDQPQQHKKPNAPQQQPKQPLHK